MRNSKFNRTLINFIFIIFLSLIFEGCGSSLRSSLSEKDLVARAKKEGNRLYTYGMPDQWASYKELFLAFEKKYGIKHLDIDMSSGAVVKRLIKEKESPAVDTGVVGITYVHSVKKEGILASFCSPYKKDLPSWAYDRSSKCPTWYATYYGTLVFMVNKEVIKNIPRTWSDLLSPEYKNKIGYLDPRISATGFATVMAANFALGGDLNDPSRGIEYFRKLHSLGNIREAQKRQNFIDFIKGVTPILINYDYNLLYHKNKKNLNAEIVVPEEGTIKYPYVNLIVKNSPHPYTTRLFLNFILSKEGQSIISASFVQPVREDVEIPSRVKELLPDYTGKKIHSVEWEYAEEAKKKVEVAWDKMLGRL